jgi:photosystem II stability/assembly factor-like uncharacterized protein
MKVSFYTLLILILFSFHSFNQTAKWTWVNPYPSGEQIIQSYFLDEQKGFVIGKVGTLLNTTDGGITWGQIETSMVNGDFLKILFTDDLNGKALGSELGPNYSQHPYFIISSNGGVTWEQYTVTQQIVSLRDMFFINDQIGWLIGDNGALFHTSDGGLSWIDKSISQVSGTTFNKIIFTNESDGVVLGFNTKQ